jgi:hypothetical protein
MDEVAPRSAGITNEKEELYMADPSRTTAALSAEGGQRLRQNCSRVVAEVDPTIDPNTDGPAQTLRHGVDDNTDLH